jgi:hypothetical protein
MIENTLAEVVGELERAIQPLGFFVSSIYRREKPTSKMERETADNAELVVTIIRREKLVPENSPSTDGLSDAFKKKK